MKKIEPKGKSGKTFEKKPTNFYYQYAAPEKAHPKVKVLVKGQKFIGTFEHTFKDTAYDKDKPPQSHLISTQDEGNIVIKGCQALNSRLEGMPRGTPVQIVYLGKGKAIKKSQRPPYLFDVYADLDAKEAETEDDAEIDTDEEFAEPVPF